MEVRLLVGLVMLCNFQNCTIYGMISKAPVNCNLPVTLAQPGIGGNIFYIASMVTIWTGLVDWTGGLRQNITFTSSSETCL